MPSKTKEVRLDQKHHWENQLKQRLSVLSEKGVKPKDASKDKAVRMIRAKMRETEARLRTIESMEKRSEELSKAKAEKASAPESKKERKKTKAPSEPETSKRQQKKQKKKTSKGQETKPKEG